jgi:hypothetical protein
VPEDVGYLHLQLKYQKMDVADILGLAFCPFGSSSKMAPCFKVVSIQHANFNQISYGRQENGRLSLKLVNTMRDFSFQIKFPTWLGDPSNKISKMFKSAFPWH